MQLIGSQFPYSPPFYTLLATKKNTTNSPPSKKKKESPSHTGDKLCLFLGQDGGVEVIDEPCDW